MATLLGKIRTGKIGESWYHVTINPLWSCYRLELKSQFHQTRQMAITEELLDIAAGFEALGGE